MTSRDLMTVTLGVVCALSVAFAACGRPATAQSFENFSDDLGLYVRDSQSEQVSIVVYDRGAVDANARARRPVVELTLHFGSMAGNWDYQADVDDRLDELLKGVPAKLAATHTEPRQGRRSYLIVSPEPSKVAAALAGLKPPAGATADVRTLDAAALETWRPTPLEFQTSQDDNVRRAIAEHGDDGTTPRGVEFFFYGGDQPALRAAATEAGFQARRAEGDRTGTILSRKTAVDVETLTELNVLFIAWSSRFQAEYDGWETEVVKKASP